MSKIERLQRRVLREAVAENVVAMRGPIALARRRRRRGMVRMWAGWLLFAAPAAFAVSTWWVVERWEPGAPTAAEPEPRETVVEAVPSPPPSIPPSQPEADLDVALGTALDPAVFPLQVRRIVLDPGHGGENRGAESVELGLVEKELTLDIAERLSDLLERAAYEVVLTRTDDRSVPLSERVLRANEAQADLFLSIHVNWIGEGEDRGVETYFLGASEDPAIARLAALANVDSGFSLAELPQVLEGVYRNARQLESRRFAEAVQGELLFQLRDITPSLVDRGVKAAPFVVLIGTEMPAVLAEVSSLSSDDEVRLLAEPAYRQYIALALFDGIRAYSSRQRDMTWSTG